MLFRLYRVVRFHRCFFAAKKWKILHKSSWGTRNKKKYAFVCFWFRDAYGFNGMSYDPPKSNHQLTIHHQLTSIIDRIEVCSKRICVQQQLLHSQHHTDPRSSHSLPFILSLPLSASSRSHSPPSRSPLSIFLFLLYIFRFFVAHISHLRALCTNWRQFNWIKGRRNGRTSEMNEMVNSKIEDQNIQPTILMYPQVVSTTSNLQSFCMKFWTDLILLNGSLCSRKPILMLFFEVDIHFL